MNSSENTTPEDEDQSGLLSDEELQKIADEMDEEPDYFSDMSILENPLRIPNYDEMTDEEAEEASEVFLNESWRRLEVLYPGTVRPTSRKLDGKRSPKGIPAWGRKLILNNLANGELIRQIAEQLLKNNTSHGGNTFHINIPSTGGYQHIPIIPSAFHPASQDSQQAQSQAHNPHENPSAPKAHINPLLIQNAVREALKEASLAGEGVDEASIAAAVAAQLQSPGGLGGFGESGIGGLGTGRGVGSGVPRPRSPQDMAFEDPDAAQYTHEDLAPEYPDGIQKRVLTALRTFQQRDEECPQKRIVLALQKLNPGVTSIPQPEQFKWYDYVAQFQDTDNELLAIEDSSQTLLQHYGIDPVDKQIRPRGITSALQLLRKYQDEAMPDPVENMGIYELMPEAQLFVYLLTHNPAVIIPYFTKVQHDLGISAALDLHKDLVAQLLEIDDHQQAISIVVALAALYRKYVPWHEEGTQTPELPNRIQEIGDCVSGIQRGLASLLKFFQSNGIDNPFDIQEGISANQFTVLRWFEASPQQITLEKLGMELYFEEGSWKIQGIPLEDFSDSSTWRQYPALRQQLRLIHHNLEVIKYSIEKNILFLNNKGRTPKIEVNPNYMPGVVYSDKLYCFPLPLKMQVDSLDPETLDEKT